MKFIITENILRKLINNMIGYDLSDHIEMITNWYDLDSLLFSELNIIFKIL